MKQEHQVTSIAFIIDGNRRWAKARGLLSTEGHKKGLDNVIESIDWCLARGMTTMTYYVFSTENWNRTKHEVEALMSLFEYMLTDKFETIAAKGVRVRFAGKTSMFSKRLQSLIVDIEEKTKKYKKTVWLCASYGGRLEIVEAAKKLAGVKNLTEKSFEKALWTADMPEPDLIIRTGGNHRLSNFLIWKAAYSELYFIDTQWPAFKEKNLVKALEWYKDSIQVNKGK